jgi:signal transduction histidine kinase/ActR/RegA family two-component response regulator
MPIPQEQNSPTNSGQGIHGGPKMYGDAALWPAQPNAAETAKLAAAKKNRYYSLLYREMEDRKRAEGQLRVSYSLLHALSHAQLRFLAGCELPEVFAELLGALLEITESHFGMIGSVAYTEDGQAAVSMLAHVIPESCSIDCGGLDALAFLVLQKGSPDQPMICSGAFPQFSANGDALHEEVAALLDTYSFLGLPLYGGDAVAGVLALGGRSAGYDGEIVEFLQPVQSACAQMILAKRMDDQRRMAELALSQERVTLAQRVAERTTELRTVNAELEYAVRARDEFLAMVNHELRTPLNAVLLLTEVLQKGIYGELNEKQQRSVRDIAESGRHLLSLISDILDVSKMEAGKLEMDMAPCSVKAVCRSSMQLVQGMAHKSDVQVSLEIAEDVESLFADPRRLKQMLVNLLSNAIKFTPAEGSVGLRVTGDRAEDVVRFTVWDTGIGISEDDIGKLFQPFVQLDSGHTRQYGGSGLGLVLVARMAEMHGGTVAVDSKVGHGSRFTISLPWHADECADEEADGICLRRAPASAVDVEAQPAPKHRRFAVEQPADEIEEGAVEPPPSSSEPLVLIADDNVPNADALSEYLSIHACRLAVAHNGLDAVEKARQLQPQLILMDIQMPEMDGIEATRRIRASEGLAEIPIVALTAAVMPGDRERCIQAGMTDFLGKPVDLDSLDRVILRYARPEEQEATVPVAESVGSE